MRWVVEFSAESGGTAATVTVDGESWKAALAAARNGKALTKFRVQLDDDGSVRVHDVVTNERFVLRPLQFSFPLPNNSPLRSSTSSPPPAVPLARSNTSSSSPPAVPVPRPSASSPPPAVPVPRPSASSPPPAVPVPRPSASSPPTVATPRVDSKPPTQFAQPADTSVSSVHGPLTEPNSVVVEEPSERTGQGNQASHGDRERHDQAALPNLPSTTPSAPAPQLPAIVVPAPATLVFERDRERAEVGLVYRERVLAVPPGTEVPWVEHIARTVWNQLREQVAQHGPGRMIVIAVFDHVFRSRPERPPLLVLTWKDWTDTGPEVTYSSAESAASPPAQQVAAPTPAASTESPLSPEVHVSAPRPASRPRAATLSYEEAAKKGSVPPAPSSVGTSTVPSSFTSLPTVADVSAVPKDQAPSRQVSQAPSPLVDAPQARRRGDELLGEAFEEMQDLAFLQEPDEACAFVASVARDVLQASFVAVSVYDIDRDELVLRSVEGGSSTLGARAPLDQGPRGEAAIQDKVIALPQSPHPDTLVPEAPTGPVMFAPARHDRRLFGVVQLHRPPSAPPFDRDEQHTAAYIANQLGKFLADHSRRVGFEGDPKRSGQ